MLAAFFSEENGMRILIKDNNRPIAVLYWDSAVIRKYNHHHDKLGRFASADGSSGEGIRNKSTYSVESSLNHVKIKSTEKVTISPDKFYRYALDPEKSPDKAIAFQKALGYNRTNCEPLIRQIENGIRNHELSFTSKNKFGKRYECIMEIKGVNGKKANVLTAWIKESDGYRLVSVYIARKGRVQK